MRYLDDVPRRSWPLKSSEQRQAAVSVAFGDDLHPAVDQILGYPEQVELKRDAPDPPSESHALHSAHDPDSEPCLRAQRAGWPARSFLAGYVVPFIEVGHQRPCRGLGWHFGQLNDDRFMNFSRRTGVPHRGQGLPCMPYTARSVPK